VSAHRDKCTRADRPLIDDTTDHLPPQPPPKRPSGWHTIECVHSRSPAQVEGRAREKLSGRPVSVLFADKFSPAPREVRLAGLLTVLPGLALIVLAVIEMAGAVGKPEAPGNNVFAEAAYFAVFGIGTVICGGGLLLGKTWARSPSVVVALLMIGVGWYAAVPSGQPGFGVPVGVVGLALLVLLFRRPSRAWVLGQEEGESEEAAAARDGAAGRAARREQGE
jgi:PGF-CTERM protein